MDKARPPADEAAPPAGDRAALEEAIRRRARAFDAPALVALLREKLPGLAIRFRGRASLATQPTLVDGVEFAPDHVVVTLNLGLRSSTSPLPSYFHELLAHPRAGPALEEILALLDDRLLRDRVDGLGPEAAERLLPRAGDLRRDALALARPASPLALRWILARIYPELGVTVRRAPVRRGMAAEDPRLGQARLGHAALGGEVEVAAPGLDVILTTEESTTWSGEPWAAEARRRLSAHVLPALRDTGAHLRVVLVDREARGRLDLLGASHLGFEALGRGEPPKATILFEGRVPQG
ncbi:MULTISPECIES: hypothetical protein [Sorangium]|uniref:Uncharacterized protein n=1 Tax=Sorangium cellulosum TaxID=56 RepID=A0A4P2QHU5_SORCE|nr:MULTISPECIES: hypothetical protein [Sorangium]AUX29121.1 uncharacterized protein SOCE836_012080 [Sorangium cellulosum]WCQ88512.1 hypothetical protein NQZ70_01190 [Sorangium sp. Soce836]